MQPFILDSRKISTSTTWLLNPEIKLESKGILVFFLSSRIRLQLSTDTEETNELIGMRRNPMESNI